MDAPDRGALTLVRLIGVMTVVMSLLELGLYLVNCYNPRHPVPVQPLELALWAIPVVVGIVILIRAKALAEWVARLLDL